MMLRSSSTPILGSLLSSFSESPNNYHHQSECHCAAVKHTALLRGGSQNFSKFSIPSPSVGEVKATPYLSSTEGFRRVQSEGNLEGLVDASYNVDELGFPIKKVARRHGRSHLEAIPSISYRKTRTYDGCEESDEYAEEDGDIEVEESGNIFKVDNLVLEEKRTDMIGYGGLETDGDRRKMYIAAGLGVSETSFLDGGGYGTGGGSGGSYRPVTFDRDGGDSHGVSIEEYYKRVLKEHPGNPLFLRNYAQFLYQRKGEGDLKGAEEYYSRAILADPEDGEVLSQYAKLIWESQHDKERATNYFERAIQASSENSHIQAAYASFLWDAEDEDEEQNNAAETTHVRPLLFQQGSMASATV
ncbi:hypothetical protein F511_08272 [Dorcoceras hygrometricum]|uniref:Uncharacterized protein n=1 Tax=Dorcoceras hygrometricum TaxID=472368 RepID=A0A2Z7AQ87_9LAMI|nr:hypothetical protein F511_08272 [Dorcoceras hygrometricum]